MSVLLARVFSELAFADDTPVVAPAPVAMPALNAPAQVLGTYEVHQIVNSDKGRQCRDKKGNLLPTPGDDRCGQKVWVVRSKDQLALIDPLKDQRDSSLFSFALYGELWNPRCDMDIRISDAIDGLFSSKFCRANHVKRYDTRQAETFIFNDKTDVLDPVVSVTLGITTTSGFTISVPKGDTPPAEIKMVKHVSGTVLLFFSGSFTDTYTLTRISD